MSEESDSLRTSSFRARLKMSCRLSARRLRCFADLEGPGGQSQEELQEAGMEAPRRAGSADMVRKECPNLEHPLEDAFPAALPPPRQV